MTPEGRVKAMIDKVLENATCPLWYFKPVQSGYGKRALDYILCVRGRFVAIEAKRPEKDATMFQRLTARQIYEAGGTVWFIRTMEGVGAFMRWLTKQ